MQASLSQLDIRCPGIGFLTQLFQSGLVVIGSVRSADVRRISSFFVIKKILKNPQWNRPVAVVGICLVTLSACQF
jgi:hypothetical protein